jgi:hypothetical protein
MPDALTSRRDYLWAAGADMALWQVAFLPRPVSERLVTKEELARMRNEFEGIVKEAA